MPARSDDLFQRLAKLHIKPTHYEHPPLGTVAESQQLRGDIPGGHCKNLLLRTKKKVPWLVVTLEDRQINLKSLAQQLGVGSFSFASPDRLMQILGVSPGEVTPFALINDVEAQVQVVLDQEMLTYEVLNYHPLVNTATIAVTPDELLAFIRSCGHEPQIVAL